ncbi:TPA: type II toxin-antitoxin system VapC family toxin [Mannheimia haemolytica]
MYLLDTNIISEIRKINTGKANQGVIDWLSAVPENQLYTNAIVLMEVERGVSAKERKDKQQGAILRKWLEQVIKPFFAQRTLTIDAQTSQVCAKLHIPDHAPENDAWIAANAIQHNFILVTHNTNNFARTGVKLLDPFKS